MKKKLAEQIYKCLHNSKLNKASFLHQLYTIKYINI